MKAGITCASRVVCGDRGEAVRRAAANLRRDIAKCCLPGSEAGTDILLREGGLEPQTYRLRLERDGLCLYAGDELGFVYGLYAISEEILGVTPFWFFLDQRFEPRALLPIPPDWEKRSEPCAVRFRGWFINDEVLLDAWTLEGSEEKPWEMAFETLLRLGGNMVIPGTDQNAHRYARLAGSFGLYVTHHHAEPLGAQMFSRAYPSLTPSYAAHPALFEGLWQEAIDSQKGRKIVYNLGFRGQGDKPFWADAPEYATPQSRGALISRLIRRQYDMVRAAQPDAPCATNLYGEMMELYRAGFIDLPDDVIRIWADNGYGKMVSRRQNNHNPRIPALPGRGEAGSHGVYYHASFYDLQAAAHMTMLPNPPAFVRRELTQALALGAGAYWLINCSNIKPHVYTLDLIAALWRRGQVSEREHLADFCARYYGRENAAAVARCYERFYECAPRYGRHEDERAGEQFANHAARMLVSQWMKDPGVPADDMRWAIDAPTLEAQVKWYEKICARARQAYRALVEECERTRLLLRAANRTRFEDSIMMQAKLLLRSYEGACLACESLCRAMQADWIGAFYAAGQSRRAFLQADAAMREREHGHWRLFYANDCLTDVKQSAWLMGVLMGVLRNHGDGPHFYHWQRRFAGAPRDEQIMLLLNTRNHIGNEEMFELMCARMEET